MTEEIEIPTMKRVHDNDLIITDNQDRKAHFRFETSVAPDGEHITKARCGVCRLNVATVSRGATTIEESIDKAVALAEQHIDEVHRKDTWVNT